MTKFIAIVGSREVPLDELELFIRLGRTFTDLGYQDSSGDAFGTDRAGWYGARQSPLYDEDKARIYVLESKRNRARAMEYGFIVAEDHPEQWVLAEAMALEARGTWAGLPNQYQRDLHIRNVYQVYGHTLTDVVEAIIYYAKPVGNPDREFVNGGTNTAVQLAKKANVPLRKNLYTKEGYEWAIEFLKRYETAEEYDEIDWHEILKPDDPRLEDL